MGLKMPKNFIEIPIDKLVLADWNYKTDDDMLTDKLTNNLKRNGQIENIIVRQLDTGFYEVVNGNHRVKAMNKIGATSVICYNLGKISDANARRIAIETNETKFQTDNLRLAKLIGEISQEFDAVDLSQTFPYTEDEMNEFHKMFSFDWNSFDSSLDNPQDGPDKVQIICPKCGKPFDVEV